MSSFYQLSKFGGEPSKLGCHRGKSGLEEEELGLDEFGLDSVSFLSITVVLGARGYQIWEVTSQGLSLNRPPPIALEPEPRLPSIAIGTEDLRS